MKFCLTCLVLVLNLSVMAQQPDTVFLKTLIESHSEVFEHVLHHPSHNEVQVLYTQIDRDEHNVPHFKSFSYRLNPNRYFYPASTVKLPTAIFALEKLNKLNIKGFTVKSTMITDSAFARQTKVTKDTSSKSGLPSIEHYIKKILLVSDNDAYNRLYEFVGQEQLNKGLWDKGYKDIRITRRFVNMNEDENRHTNGIRFYWKNKLVYQQAPAISNIN